MLAALLAATAAAAAASAPPPPPADTAVQLVLYGATGSLAHKYLWQAALETADALFPARLLVTAVARESNTTGAPRVAAALRAAACGPPAAGALSAAAHAAYCGALKAALLADTEYVSLGRGDAAAHGRLRDAVEGAASRVDLQSRVLYMAVSPEHVVPLLLAAHEAGLSLMTSPRGFITRVVLEKPVGRDGGSAATVMSGAQGLTEPSSVLMVDHFLGKAGLAAAVAVRSRMVNDVNLGKATGGGSSSDGAARDAAATPKPGAPPHRFDDREGWVRLATTLRYSDVVLLESESLEGRTGFYNEQGVLRDVLQSHMTVMATATALLPGHPWGHAGRERMLAHLLPLTSKPSREEADMRGSAASAMHRFGAYAGYAAAVQAAAAAVATNGSAGGHGGGATPLAWPVRAPVPRGAAMPDAAAHARRHGESPVSSQLWGPLLRELSGVGGVGGDAAAPPAPPPVFVAATGAQVMISGLGVPLVMTSGKALGLRTAYVRQYYTPAIAPPGMCGPVTVTYHLSGTPQLTVGGEPEAWPASFPTLANLTERGGPLVAFSGFCGESVDVGLLPDPRALFRAGYVDADWPAGWEWEVHYDSHSGVLLALPLLHAGLPPSLTIAALALRDGALAEEAGREPAASHAAAPAEREGETAAAEGGGAWHAVRARVALLPPAAHANASSAAAAPLISPRLLRARLRALLAQPGAGSGADAYRTLLAAALLGEESLFQSPEEVAATWKLWEALAALQDETMATGMALHWNAPQLQVDYETQRRALVVARRRAAAARNASVAAAAAAAPAGEDEEEGEHKQAHDDERLLAPRSGHPAGDVVYVYPRGDRSWMRALPPPTAPLPRRGARWGGDVDNQPQRQPLAGRLRGTAPAAAEVPVEVVVASTPGADVSSQFASDALALFWDTLRSSPSPFVHWAVDSGPELTALLDRWPSLDVAAQLPLPALHLWGVAERHAEGTAPDCNVCYVYSVLAQRIGLPEAQMHGLLHPNVSHLNALAAAALAPGGGAFDLVTLRVPGANSTAHPGAMVGLLPPLANYTSHPYLAGAGAPSAAVSLQRGTVLPRVPGLAAALPELAAAWAAAAAAAGDGGAAAPPPALPPSAAEALGDPARDDAVYLSTGLGLWESLEEEAALLANLTAEQRAQIDAATRPSGAAAALASASASASAAAARASSSSGTKKRRKLAASKRPSSRFERGVPDLSAVPARPLVPFLGPVDIRLSPRALQRAKHVWVVVPESRLGRVAGAAGAGTPGAASAAAAVGPDGQLLPASAAAAAAAAGGDNVLGGVHFPPELVDDLALVTAGRAVPVRLYVVRGI